MKKILTLGLMMTFSCHSSQDFSSEVKHHGRPSPQMSEWIDITLANPQIVLASLGEIERQLDVAFPNQPTKDKVPPEDASPIDATIDTTPSDVASDGSQKVISELSPESESDPVPPEPDNADISPPSIDLTHEIDLDSTFWVNKEFQLSKSFAPADLEAVPYKYTNGISRSLRKKALDAFIAMAEHAEKTAKIKLLIISAYRSYDDQAGAFAYWKGLKGEIQAERESAWPGHSEHQLGLTMDLNTPGVTAFENFDLSPAGKWVKDNAHLFGFTISYQKHTEGITGYMFEPWHIRYVGRVIAAQLYNNGQVTEELMLSLTDPPQADFDEIGGKEECISKYSRKTRPDMQLWTCAESGAKINRCNTDFEVIFYPCEDGCYSCPMGTNDFCSQNEGTTRIAKERGCKLILAEKVAVKG